MTSYFEIYVNGERVAQMTDETEYRQAFSLVTGTVKAFHKNYKVSESVTVYKTDEFVTLSVRFVE